MARAGTPLPCRPARPRPPRRPLKGPLVPAPLPVPLVRRGEVAAPGRAGAAAGRGAAGRRRGSLGAGAGAAAAPPTRAPRGPGCPLSAGPEPPRRRARPTWSSGRGAAARGRRAELGARELPPPGGQGASPGLLQPCRQPRGPRLPHPCPGARAAALARPRKAPSGLTASPARAPRGFSESRGPRRCRLSCELGSARSGSCEACSLATTPRLSLDSFFWTLLCPGFPTASPCWLVPRALKTRGEASPGPAPQSAAGGRGQLALRSGDQVGELFWPLSGGKSGQPALPCGGQHPRPSTGLFQG